MVSFPLDMPRLRIAAMAAMLHAIADDPRATIPFSEVAWLSAPLLHLADVVPAADALRISALFRDGRAAIPMEQLVTLAAALERSAEAMR